MRAKVVTILGLVAAAAGQDTTPCETYDVNSGRGTCNGISVAIGNVICAGGFNAGKCKAQMSSGNGGTETYFFKGTPTGLPIGTSIQSDCSTSDFPAAAGIAMAQTYQDGSGNPAGCYPAADVQGTTLTYTAGGAGTLQSVTVNFNVHTDNGGTQRDGFIKITCQAGGPTSGFSYSTIGDQGHQSQYEIDTTADCANSGGGGGGGGGGGTNPQKNGDGGEVGWILVGLTLGGFAAYLGAGYVYNWKVKGAESGERIPNKDFWASLPGLISTGFKFTIAKVKREEYQPL